MDVWARRGHFYLCLSLGLRDTHFVALRHSMATCIPRVDGLSTDPWVLGHHKASGGGLEAGGF